MQTPGGGTWTTTAGPCLGEPVRQAGLGLRGLRRRGRRREPASTRSCSTTCASPPTATSTRAVYPGSTSQTRGRGDRGLRRLRQEAPEAARRAHLDGGVRALGDARSAHRPGAEVDLAVRRQHQPDGLSGALRRRRARDRDPERRARRDGLPDARGLQAALRGTEGAARPVDPGLELRPGAGAATRSRPCGSRERRATCSGTPQAGTRKPRWHPRRRRVASLRREPEARASRRRRVRSGCGRAGGSAGSARTRTPPGRGG